MNLYVILIIISTVRNENILSFDYTSIGGLIALNFNYYNYNRSGLFINTAFPFSIINKNYQDGIGSKRMLDLSLWLVEKEYAYTLIESNFTLGQAHLDNYKYYLQSNDKRHLSDVLSLSFKHDEESLSFVHLLYKERQIEKRQFAFEGMKNRLFIGGVPNNLHKKMLYKGKCKIKENVYEWTCPIKRVSYGDIILDMNEEAIFYSSIDDAIYSNQLFDFMINRIFKTQIEKSHCTIKQLEGDIHFLHCLGLVFYNKLNNITMTLGDMTFSVPTEVLFGYYGRQDSLFNNNPFPEYQNKTIIGMSLLSKFNYVVFDYDNKVVEFYSDVYSIVQEEGNEKIKIIYICLFVVEMIGVVQLLIKGYVINNK